MLTQWRGVSRQSGWVRGFHASAVLCVTSRNDHARKKVKRRTVDLSLRWKKFHAWRRELEEKFEAIKNRPVIHWKGPAPLQTWLVDLQQNEPLGILPLDRRVWGCEIRKDIVHRVVRWQRAGWRTAQKHTKLRSERRGGGRKPRPQKGSGQARLGSRRSPLVQGGGVAHGPRKERDFSFDLPAKVVNASKCIALSAKFQEGNLIVIKDTLLQTHKTNDLLQLFATKYPNIHQGQIAVIHGEGELDPNFALAARSLYNFDFYTANTITTYDLVKRHHLIVTEAGLAELEQRLLKLQTNPRINFVVDVPAPKLEELPRYPVYKGRQKQTTAQTRLEERHLREEARSLRVHAYM